MTVTRKLFVSLWLGGIALPFFQCPAFAQSGPGSGFDVTRYKLELSPDIATKTVAGRQTITLRSTIDGLKRLSFSGNALIIDQATLNGVAVGHSLRDGVLDFDLPMPLARGATVKLAVAYHGKPARGIEGTANAMFTNYFACDWMICAQNTFGDKAGFSIDLRVPRGMSSLSVGRLISTRPGRDGTAVHSWQVPRPYSAYLFGFAIGRYARASEITGKAKLTYLSDSADSAELKRRFAKTRDVAAFFSKKSGVALPVAEYSQLLVEGDIAQEAATYSVIGINALPKTLDDTAEDWAIAHELAHQWWGNLVTCATLQDFWLNEGITTFMTAAWKEHRYGLAAYEAELDVARSRLARAKAQGFDKPLAWVGTYPTLGTRRAIQYSKGALFMAHLRTTVGDAVFWAGLRRYTRAHAGGTVTSADLQKAMEAASGRDLRPLFAEWVFGDSSSERPLSPQIFQ